MSYATLDDVRALAPHLSLNGTSRPTEDAASLMVADVERLIDAMLGTLGIVTPVTGVASRSLLRDVAAHGALARVLRARAYGVGDSNAPGAAEAQAFFDNTMKALMDPKNPFTLPDATFTGSGVEKTDLRIIESQVQGLTAEQFDPDDPPFTRNQVF